MDHVKNILDRTLKVFIKYGIKSVTMDDISSELGISKKTLYQHFDSKDDFIYKTMQHYIEIEEQGVEKIIRSSENAIDELMHVCNFIASILKERNPALMFDLKKHHPESWQIFQKHKKEFTYTNIVQNINKGIEQGLYSKNFDIEVIAKFYMIRLETVIDPELFPFKKYPLYHIISEMFKYHIRGIATRKGLNYLEKLNKNDNNYEN